MGSVLSRLFCGCCKYKRGRATISGSYSNEGYDKCTEFYTPVCPPIHATDNPHVETRMDRACINNGETGACGFDNKWTSSQSQQRDRFPSNTTRENKTNKNSVTVTAINSIGSQIAIPNVAKVTSHSKRQSEDANVVPIESHTRHINSTDIDIVNRHSHNVSYLTM